MTKIANHLPQSEWECSEVRDAMATDPTGTANCEFCGRLLRWVHILHHEEYERPVEAGCCCAARYCYEYDADGAEREARNRFSRRMRFVDRKKWKTSRKNPTNIWRDVRMPDNTVLKVTIFLTEGRYMVFLAGRGKDQHCHQCKYATQEEALNAAFELVDERRRAGG